MTNYRPRDFLFAAAIGVLLALVIALSSALWVALREQQPARPVAVEASARASTLPPSPARATADDLEPPESVKRLAAEFNAQDAKARQERIEAQYVAHLREQLRRNVDPGIVSKYIDPALDPESMKKGDVGTFATIRVTQIIEDDVFLANVDDVAHVVIRGMSTADLVDGRVFKGRELVFEAFGPISYDSILGAKKTVMAVKLIDATEFRKLGRAKLKEDWEIRTGRKSKPSQTEKGDKA